MAIHGDKQFDLITRLSAIIENLLRNKAHDLTATMYMHLGESRPKTVLHADVESELTSETC